MKLSGFVADIKTPLLVDTFKYAASKGVPGLIGLASVWCFVKLIGKEGYGQYAILFSIANMAAVFSSGWIQQSLLRFYTVYENERHLLIRATIKGIGAVLAVGCLISFIIGFSGHISAHQVYEPVVMVAVWGLFFCLVIHTCLIAVYQAQVRPGLVVKLELLRSILVFIIPLSIIVTIKASYLSLVLGIVLGYLFSFLWMNQSIKGLWHHQVTMGAAAKKGIRKIFIRFIAYGLPLSLWLALMSAFPVVDRFLITYYFDFSETGIYASIYDIVIRSFSLFLFPVVMASHPRIMKAWNSGDSLETRKLIKASIITQFLIFSVVFLAYLAFADLILLTLFEQTSHRLKMVIVLLAIGGFLWQLSLTVHKPFEVKQRTWMMVVGILISLVVNVCINVLFLPKLGLVAPGIASIAGAMCYLTICAVQYRNISILMNKSVR